MSGLLKKYNDYLKITACKIQYEFQNGFVLEFKFEKTNFLHMAGIHKLIDIPLVQKFNSKKVSANYVISKIKNGTLTESILKSSKYFSQIQKRYDEFNSDFFQPTDYYIKNQIQEKIKKMQMIKTDGTILFEDEF